MSEMKKLISEFPNNFDEAKAIALGTKIQTPNNEIQNVIICGMGGSGIGGDFVSKWLEDEIMVPIKIIKDYAIPAFVSKNSLVIGSSYSGNTEETLSAVEQAIGKGAHVIGITSGGKMKALCESHGFDTIIVPGGNPPRTALAYSIFQLVNIFVKLGMADSQRLNELMIAQERIIKEESLIKELAVEHLTGIKDLTKKDIEIIFKTADAFKEVINRPIKNVTCHTTFETGMSNKN